MLRVCLISDIHGNLQALESVVKAVDDCDEWWCAGDIVGYGPYPNECVVIARDLGTKCVAGNHDLASIGKIGLKDFNDIARFACEWTSARLTAESKDYLRSLPLIREIRNETGLYHGSFRDPIWEYIMDPYQAVRNFHDCDFPISYIGHSHVPMVFALRDDGELWATIPDDGFQLTFEVGTRYIVNVGSVGQPRDGDPRACFVIYDMESRTIKFNRVEYSIEKVQNKMMEVGLPEYLSARLSFGR